MEPYNEIKELLLQAGYAHFADCFGIIPAQNMTALQALVKAHKERGTQREVYRYQVVQDVAALVEGNIHCPLFSENFLKGDTAIQQTIICERCQSDHKPAHKVSIPESDLEYMCTDCIRELPMAGVVNYITE